MKKIELFEKTIFDCKSLCFFLRLLALLLLKITGWKFVGEEPMQKKCVVIGAPHTSYWDFFKLIAIVLVCRRKVHWLGKNSLFCFKFLDSIFKWLGGIPTERERSNGMVAQLAKLFSEMDELILVLSPEGTRGVKNKITRWRKGFYRIAQEANLPIFLGFVDKRNKELGIRKKPFFTTGKLEEDMKRIKEYYAGKLGGNLPQIASIA